MKEQDINQLAINLNLDLAFLRAIFNRFKPENETEFIKIVNDISELKNEVDTDDTQDLIDFYEFRKAEQEKIQEKIKKGETAGEQKTAIADLNKSETINEGSYKKNFGDVNNPEIAGVGIGGRVSVVDEMLGKESPITQAYANYNPDIEPTTGGRNWGTDFRSSVGTEIKNIFNSDLEVVRVADGYGKGSLGNRDNDGFGNQIVVRRKDTGEVLDIAHLEKGINYKPGDIIKSGDVIAKTGESGNSSGPHVSIEAYDQNGTIKDISNLNPIGDKSIVSYDDKNEPVYQRTSTGIEKLKPEYLDKNRLSPQLEPSENDKLIQKVAQPTTQPTVQPTAQPTIQPIGQQTVQPIATQAGQIAPAPTINQPTPTISPAVTPTIAPIQEKPVLPTPTPGTKQGQLNVADENQINQIVSKLPEGQKEAAKKAIPYIAQALDNEGILTPEVLAYAISTVGHESSFVPKEEILAQRGVNPRNDYIANLQANYEGGQQYRGRGYIQLTHQGNYKKFGDRIGEDLVSNPDRLLDPEVSAKVLAAYFKDNGVANAVESDDLITARKLIQGSGAVNPQFIKNTRDIANESKSLSQVIKDTKAVLPKEAINPETELEKVTTNARLLQGKPVVEQQEPENIFQVFGKNKAETNKNLLDYFANAKTYQDTQQNTQQAIQNQAEQTQQTINRIGQQSVGAKNIASNAANLTSRSILKPQAAKTSTVKPSTRASTVKTSPTRSTQTASTSRVTPAAKAVSAQKAIKSAVKSTPKSVVKQVAKTPVKSYATAAKSYTPAKTVTKSYSTPAKSYSTAKNYSTAAKSSKPAAKKSTLSKVVGGIKKWLRIGGGGHIPNKGSFYNDFNRR